MTISQLQAVVKGIVGKSKHILAFYVDEKTGEIKAIGDDCWLTNQINAGLFQRNLQLLENSRSSENLEIMMLPKPKFGRLFACPGTKSWKGALKIRKTASDMFKILGFGVNMSKKYGQGEPPNGFIGEWSTFEGPSKSCTVEQCTNMIIGLLDGEGIRYQDHHDGLQPEEGDPREEDSDEINDDEENESDLNESFERGRYVTKRKQNSPESLQV